MGDGFSVVPRELTDAAATIREVGEQLAASQALRYKTGAKAVGDDTLAAAMGEVQDASERTASVLDSTSRAIANRLSNTAATYQSVDHIQADMITGKPESSPVTS